MSRRRVVVTGLGCISPVGNTVGDAWANLLSGQSGIDQITKFDASSFACRIAGEVKGFDLESYISAKEARSMDSFIHYGIAAADQAVRDAGLPTGEALGEGRGGFFRAKYSSVAIQANQKGPKHSQRDSRSSRRAIFSQSLNQSPRRSQTLDSRPGVSSCGQTLPSKRVQVSPMWRLVLGCSLS